MLVRMLYVCGLRVSEALSLKVDDIDFSLNCLSVRKAKSDIVTEDIGISTHDLTKRSTEMAIFSDIDTRKSEDFKFKSGQICFRASIFAGGAVAAYNGFIRAKKKATAAAKA